MGGWGGDKIADFLKFNSFTLFISAYALSLVFHSFIDMLIAYLFAGKVISSVE